LLALVSEEEIDLGLLLTQEPVTSPSFPSLLVTFTKVQRVGSGTVLLSFSQHVSFLVEILGFLALPFVSSFLLHLPFLKVEAGL